MHTSALEFTVWLSCQCHISKVDKSIKITSYTLSNIWFVKDQIFIEISELPTVYIYKLCIRKIIQCLILFKIGYPSLAQCVDN